MPNDTIEGLNDRIIDLVKLGHKRGWYEPVKKAAKTVEEEFPRSAGPLPLPHDVETLKASLSTIEAGELHTSSTKKTHDLKAKMEKLGGIRKDDASEISPSGVKSGPN